MIKIVLLLVLVAFLGIAAAQQQGSPVIVSFQYAEVPASQPLAPEPAHISQQSPSNSLLSPPQVNSEPSHQALSSHQELSSRSLSNSSVTESVDILEDTRNVTMSVVPIAGGQSHDLRPGSSQLRCNSSHCSQSNHTMPRNGSSSSNSTHHSLPHSGRNITSHFNASETRGLFNSSASHSKNSLLADHHNKSSSTPQSASSKNLASPVLRAAVLGLPLVLSATILLL